jgi:hypothetical protein
VLDVSLLAVSRSGPATGAIGLMAAGTLALALGFMLLVIDSGRLYLEQRKLQRVADTAALEAVTRDGNCLSGRAPPLTPPKALPVTVLPSTPTTR